MAATYLLDTNIFVHLVRNDSVGKSILRRYRLLSADPKPAYSIVTAGEILAIALRNGWGIGKLAYLQSLLDYFGCILIDNRTLADNYAVVANHAESNGFILGKNDLWIAATAYANELTLLTTDRDFDCLAGSFVDRDWIDPDSAGGP